MTIRSRRIVAGAGVLVVTCVVSLAGCVGYSTYPAMQGAGGGKNPNVGDLYENAAFAIKWAMHHYPPGQATAPMTETYHALSNAPRVDPTGEVAVSFLPGMRRESCLRMMELIGPGAVPLTPETAHLPTYRASTVDVTGDAARVTVHRPVGTLATGEPIYQAITIKLRGGLRRWTVVSHRVWDVATVSPTPLVFLPGVGEGPEGSILDPLPMPAPSPEGGSEAAPGAAPEADGSVETPASGT